MTYQITILATRNLSPVSPLMIDIDHFKQFNDPFGHKTGEQVIDSVSDTTNGCNP
ncbi:MAG: diguanylate cyclase [Acidobacteria bacterium]|nr:diguanylate cyclase [Acidobacteriota bacterium]